jgi:hypothetical protein
LESNFGELKSKNQRKKERNKLKKRTLKQMETKQVKSTLFIDVISTDYLPIWIL